ncbi:CAAX prenyl protease [Ananas comosus]|uniref:CAAX prenyl protease n=1 Tax=Ananas comosus TaxID=4615 RepID=A0A199VFM0_ANACO|nr:CAAX prenyl protease [Ananas comosus]
MALPYLEAVLGFMILMYIFETYLNIRQHAALKLPTLPKPLEGVVSQEKFEKSRAYSLDRSRFRFIHEAVTILMDTAILYFGILPWFWKKSGEFVAYAGLNAENEIIHTLSFLAGVMIWSQQTLGLFIRDIIKGIERRTLLSNIPMGFYVCVVHSNDDALSHPNRSSIQ